MRNIVIRICQIAALLTMFGLGAMLLDRVYLGLVRSHTPGRRSASAEFNKSEIRRTKNQ